MTRVNRMIGAGVVAVSALTVFGVPIRAQGDQGTQAPPATLATLPVQVDVVLTRWQGEKRTSSMPFVLIANASSRGSATSIRMGVDVPVGTSTSNVSQTQGAGGNSPREVTTAKMATEFRNVGTDIDAIVSRPDATNFSVGLNIRDSSIFTSDQTKLPNTLADPTAFRTFSASNTLHMTDGQTRLFGVATDKITGETLRIEVKLTVLK
jgi:hypothetical protein